jgi:hypothetical protein
MEEIRNNVKELKFGESGYAFVADSGEMCSYTRNWKAETCLKSVTRKGNSSKR